MGNDRDQETDEPKTDHPQSDGGHQPLIEQDPKPPIPLLEQEVKPPQPLLEHDDVTNALISISDQTAEKLGLEPLPYQLAVRDYLKEHEPGLWAWFSKTRTLDEHADAIRFDLLKTTYRIDREAEKDLYQRVEAVAKTLELDVPITLYQAQNPQQLNASICALVHEAHIILHGPVRDRLTDKELDSTFAHELGHLMMWRNWNREFLVTELILAALTKDARAQPAHFETARLFRLHTEIFCDRAEIVAIGDPLISLSSLVKFSTNLDDVNPASYLKQAREIQQKGELGSEGVTHPETFIRAIAINDWANAAGDSKAQELSPRVFVPLKTS